VKNNSEIKIIIDTDPDLGYEKNSRLYSFFHWFFVQVLNNLPISTRSFIKKSHYSAQRVIEKATTHEAIEILYKHGVRSNSKTLFQKLFFKIWFATNNPKAVRNRLRLVTRELKKAIQSTLSKKDNVEILSIAAGSARAILDSIAEEAFKNKKVSVTFLDKNPLANDYSKELSVEYNYPVNYNLRWVVDNAKNFPNHFNNSVHPDVIEIVGLLDYFDDEAVLAIFSLIYKELPDNGYFITSNIVDNTERKFVTKVVGWPMIYRKPEDFFKLAIKAGFNPDKLEFFYEPFKIHFLMVAKK